MLSLVSASLVSAVLALPLGGGDGRRSESPTKSASASKEGGIAGAAAPCSCTGDLNDSGSVDAGDLAILLGQWGATSGPADLNADGIVNAGDLAILLGAWGPCGAPANDDCIDSILIGEGVTPFCTVSATTDGPAFPAGSDCIEFGSDQINKDVWFTYAPIGDGKLTVSTCGTDWDTRIAVYGSVFDGPIGCPTSGIGLVSLLACNDDFCGSASLTTLNVIGGRQYKIRVGGFASASGNGILTLNFTSAGSECFSAITVQNPQSTTVFGTTLDNDAGIDESSCGDGDTVAEWYTFFNTCPNPFASMTISTCVDETDFDTVISVYRPSLQGCTSIPVACNDDATGVNCQIGGLQRKSRVNFPMSPGDIFVVRVSGFNGAKGNFGLKFTADNCN